MARTSLYKIIAALITISAVLAACAMPPFSGPSRQGWSGSDRESWYWATQGSRLMPNTWFEALERPDSQDKFSDVQNLTRFGFLAPPQGSSFNRPIGFAVDQQADSAFNVSGIEWYDGQGHSDKDAEPWIGLNCSACHTAQIEYDGVTSLIDGGPNLLDFQLFVEALDDALKATKSDPQKWERFSQEVLSERDTPANREKLESAFDGFLAWQIKTDAMNETPIRYGFGRLDAVGHILNKVLMFNGAEANQGNPSNAPVSYPFIWDIWRQDRVQWNGVARNSRFQLPGDSFEYGALGRNTGEVLGVFGEVIIPENPGSFATLKGFTSTVQAENLVDLELILQDLDAPEWPAHFPAIDQNLADIGKGLFKEQCADCHLTPDMQSADVGTEVMVTFEETLAKDPRDLTDIWMACNAFTYEGPTGLMKGMKDADGEDMGNRAPVANMLTVAVKGSLLGDKTSLVKSAVRNFLGIRKDPDVFETGVDPREAAEDRCLDAKNQPLLAYKARPLDGIWATAPYLHNGSVASLYELLLPASERESSFWVGNRTYDPANVGYVTDKPESGGFLLQTKQSNGRPILGNSNAGHEYGAGALTQEDRMALVEYMKTL